MQDYHTKSLLYEIRELLKEIRDSLKPQVYVMGTIDGSETDDAKGDAE